MNEHSPKFQIVLDHYKNHRWNAAMVRNAVGRWITEAEAEEIIGAEV
jgi:hypothetical protein